MVVYRWKVLSDLLIVFKGKHIWRWQRLVDKEEKSLCLSEIPEWKAELKKLKCKQGSSFVASTSLSWCYWDHTKIFSNLACNE